MLRPLLPLLLFLAACGGPEAEPDARLRRVGELPEAYRETWVSWVEQSPEWPEWRARALEDPKLGAFLVDNLARVMLKTYHSSSIARADAPEVGPFERSRAELRRLGEVSVPTLAELVAIGDGSASYLCREILVDIGRPAVPYVASMLDRKEAQERARAAELLGRLPRVREGEVEIQRDLARLLLEDPDWLVRKSSAEALGLRGAQDVQIDTSRGPLVRGLSDEDPEVARAAAFGLARLGDPRVVPALLNFLQRAQARADVVSYEAGQRVLRSLTRTKASRTPDEWRRWWSANRGPLLRGGKR